MNEEHEYFHQIHGQIHLTQSVKGYLLVYTGAELGVAEIPKDNGWASNLAVLTNFYFSKMMPLIMAGDED